MTVAAIADRLRRADGRTGFGICLMSDIRELGALGRGFEAAGASSIWVGEYFRGPHPRVAVLAGATQRALLGTHIQQAFARSPLAAALAAVELRDLSRGRFVLGLGSQVPAANLRWHAREIRSPLGALSEYVDVVRAIVGHDHDQPLRLPGPRYPLCLPPFSASGSPEPIPIGLGAAGPRSASLAFEKGDLVIGHLFWTVERAAGLRPPTGSSAALTVARIVAPRSVGSWQIDAATQLAYYAATPTYRSYLDALPTPPDHDRLRGALRASDDDALVEAAAPLLDEFCIADAEGLIAARTRAEAMRVDAIVGFAPYLPGLRQPPEVYERATIELLRESR